MLSTLTQGKSCPMENIIEIRKHIKRDKISLRFLSKYMGYSYTHISSVLNEKKNCSLPFRRLLYLALMHHAGTDQKQLTKNLEELWTP